MWRTGHRRGNCAETVEILLRKSLSGWQFYDPCLSGGEEDLGEVMLNIVLLAPIRIIPVGLWHFFIARDECKLLDQSKSFCF